MEQREREVHGATEPRIEGMGFRVETPGGPFFVPGR
jgi:hypothetical protein